jgi:hypothetical protein
MEYQANTWDEFLGAIKAAKASLRDPGQVWFRGQSNASYSLLPSLMRIAKASSNESQLFQKFVQYSYKVFQRRTSDWETLFDMQHYGLPTRLLDWSDTLGIATFFAVNYHDLSTKADAAIYILDPVELNEYSGLKKVPFIPDDLDFDYRKIYWEKRPFAPVYPIAIQPLFQNDRIFAQSGVFTVHGDDLSPIEKLCPRAVKRVVLKQGAIQGAHEFLEVANINARTVFPDMWGVANYVRQIIGV